MPRVEIIEAAKLVARAVEKERLFITISFPSIARRCGSAVHEGWQVSI
jgi:hypothetical protein